MITDSIKSKVEEQRAIRKAYCLPYRCECGGRMEYAVAFERVWSCCSRCSPVVVVTIPRAKASR